MVVPIVGWGQTGEGILPIVKFTIHHIPSHSLEKVILTTICLIMLDAFIYSSYGTLAQTAN